MSRATHVASCTMRIAQRNENRVARDAICVLQEGGNFEWYCMSMRSYDIRQS